MFSDIRPGPCAPGPSSPSSRAAQVRFVFGAIGPQRALAATCQSVGEEDHREGSANFIQIQSKSKVACRENQWETINVACRAQPCFAHPHCMHWAPSRRRRRQRHRMHQVREGVGRLCSGGGVLAWGAKEDLKRIRINPIYPIGLQLPPEV